MAHKAGDEVLAYCGSCKMDLRAVIIAMEGPRIARVQCRTCKGMRAYRAPLGAKDPGAIPASAMRRRTVPTEKKEVKTISVYAEWANQMSERKHLPRVTYSAATVLKEGDVIQHPTFGEGIVQKLQFPNKADILFQDDIRTLIHSRS